MPRGRVPRDDIEIWTDLVHQLHTRYVVDENGCWIWQGLHFDNGYGRLARHLPRVGLSMRAHIAQYQLYFGEVPEGLFVCHSCDVKNCVNIDHLWLGTNQENQLDASKKGIFNRYWTPERREKKRLEMSGAGNPMYGLPKEEAPCFGRTGDKHPMFGKHHTEEAKSKISKSLINTRRK